MELSKKYYSFTEAGKMLGVSRARVHVMFRNGQFKAEEWAEYPRYISAEELSKLVAVRASKKGCKAVE